MEDEREYPLSPQRRNRSISAQNITIPWRRSKRFSAESLTIILSSTSESVSEEVAPMSPVRLANFVKSTPSPGGWDCGDWTPRLTSRRKSVHEELVDTEMYYVRNLELLREYYMIPIKNEALIEEHVYSVMFQGFEEIYNLNKILVEDLKKIIPMGLMPKERLVDIALLFKITSPMFQVYSSTISNYKFALDVLSVEQKRNRKLSSFLERTTKILIESNHRLTTLDGYLITPAQRLPRYILLLTDMLRSTDEGTEEYKYLKEAIKAMNDSIRTCMIEVIAYQKMLDSVNVICHGKLREMCKYIAPHRRLLGEEVDSGVYIDENNVLEPCNLYLLTDLLLIQLKNRKSNKAIALRKGDYCPETGFILKNVEVMILNEICFAILCRYIEDGSKILITCFKCTDQEQMEKLSGGLIKCLSNEVSKRRSNSHLRSRNSERCTVM
jgi:hypothetical protein